MLAFTLRRAIQAIGVMIAVGDHRVFDVPLRRRSGQPDGRASTPRPPSAPRSANRSASTIPCRCSSRAISPTRRSSSSASPTSSASRSPTCLKERMPATLELATCATILAMVFGILMGVYSALRRDTVSGQDIPGGLADRNLAADLPDRHPADLSVRGDAGLAAVVRPRRRGADRLVDHRAAHDLGPQGADPAVDHARPVPDDPDHAAGAGRDAGGAAHRLHPLRPRARPDRRARSISATR